MDHSHVPVANAQTSSSAFIEKYQMGEGRNKINVRIFKEPAIEPDTQKSEEHEEAKQVKTDFTATPTDE